MGEESSGNVGAASLANPPLVNRDRAKAID